MGDAEVVREAVPDGDGILERLGDSDMDVEPLAVALAPTERLADLLALVLADTDGEANTLADCREADLEGVGGGDPLLTLALQLCVTDGDREALPLAARDADSVRDLLAVVDALLDGGTLALREAVGVSDALRDALAGTELLAVTLAETLADCVALGAVVADLDGVAGTEALAERDAVRELDTDGDGANVRETLRDTVRDVVMLGVRVATPQAAHETLAAKHTAGIAAADEKNCCAVHAAGMLALSANVTYEMGATWSAQSPGATAAKDVFCIETKKSAGSAENRHGVKGASGLSSSVTLVSAVMRASAPAGSPAPASALPPRSSDVTDDRLASSVAGSAVSPRSDMSSVLSAACCEKKPAGSARRVGLPPNDSSSSAVALYSRVAGKLVSLLPLMYSTVSALCAASKPAGSVVKELYDKYKFASAGTRWRSAADTAAKRFAWALKCVSAGVASKSAGGTSVSKFCATSTWSSLALLANRPAGKAARLLPLRMTRDSSGLLANKSPGSDVKKLELMSTDVSEGSAANSGDAGSWQLQ